MKKYLVQSILLDGKTETVIDSFQADDYEKMLEFIMKRHKHSNKYLYMVMEIDSQKIIKKTNKNKYFL